MTKFLEQHCIARIKDEKTASIHYNYDSLSIPTRCEFQAAPHQNVMIGTAGNREATCSIPGPILVISSTA